MYGGVDNDLGAWGVSTHKDLVFLSYVCAFIPFTGNWTGVTILSYENPLSSPELPEAHNGMALLPNPAHGMVTLSFDHAQANASVRITDVQGKTVQTQQLGNVQSAAALDVSHLSKGLYFVSVQSGWQLVTKRLIIH